MSGLGVSCSPMADIAGSLPWGDVAAVDGGVEGAGACQGWTHCQGIRPALLPPNSPPSLTLPLHRGLAGCFGGGPEAHSTIIPMIL